MASKYGFKVVTPLVPTPREREERRLRDAARRFEKARHTIAAILRDYNAARCTDLSVDPRTYFVDGELVIPQYDGESLRLAHVLHEQTGIDVRMTRRAVGFAAWEGSFGRPVSTVETVAVVSGEAPVAASVPADALRSAPQAEERHPKPMVATPAPLAATGG